MARQRKDDRTGSRHVNRQMIAVKSEDHAALEQLAKRYGRPLSWEVRLLLHAGLAEEGLWTLTEEEKTILAQRKALRSRQK